MAEFLDTLKSYLPEIDGWDLVAWTLIVLTILLVLLSAGIALKKKKNWGLVILTVIAAYLAMAFGLPAFFQHNGYDSATYLSAKVVEVLEKASSLYIVVVLLIASCMIAWFLYQRFLAFFSSEETPKPDGEPADSSKKTGFRFPEFTFDAKGIAIIIGIAAVLFVLAIIVAAGRPRTEDEKLVKTAQAFPGNPFQAQSRPYFRIVTGHDQLSTAARKTWTEDVNVDLAKGDTNMVVRKIIYVIFESKDKDNLDAFVHIEAEDKDTGEFLGKRNVHLREPLGAAGFQEWAKKQNVKLENLGKRARVPTLSRYSDLDLGGFRTGDAFDGVPKVR